MDIARAIAADLGVEAEFVNIGFDGLYDALLARRVDLIISGLPYDPRWTQDVAYTINYFNAGQVLVVRTDEQAITEIEDLAARTVAVEWGSQAEMEAPAVKPGRWKKRPLRSLRKSRGIVELNPTPPGNRCRSPGGCA